MVDILIFCYYFMTFQVKTKLDKNGKTDGLKYGCADECTSSTAAETGGSYTPMGGNATTGPIVHCCNHDNCNDENIGKNATEIQKIHQNNFKVCIFCTS